MRKLVFLSIGAVMVGSLMVVACVADEAAAPQTGAQGELDGPCFANGTCQPGLSCGVVKGAAQCVSASDASAGDSSSGGDSSTGDAGSTMDASSDSGTAACSFTTTVFPCKEPAKPPVACYDSLVGCTASGCLSTEVEWDCFSPRQCATLINCCLPLANAALHTGTTCAEGTLQMTLDGGGLGGTCLTTGGACATSDIQLCQANSDCPSNLRCVPVEVVGGGSALSSLVHIGACVP
jgi:hypothetical protein